MYNKNNLKRNVLITAEEVITHAPTTHDVDPRILEQSIIIAEERFIRPALCQTFYDLLRVSKNKLVTDANLADLSVISEIPGLKVGDIVNSINFVQNPYYQTLWTEILWKTIAEAVMYTATPTNWSQFAAQGQMLNNPRGPLSDGTGASSVTVKEIQFLMDKAIQDRIDPLISSMHLFICNARANFPYYCKECEKDAKGLSVKRKTGWIDVYGKTKKTCGGRDYETPTTPIVNPIAITMPQKNDEIIATAGQILFQISRQPNGMITMYRNGAYISTTAYSYAGGYVTYNPDNNEGRTMEEGDRVNFLYFYII